VLDKFALIAIAAISCALAISPAPAQKSTCNSGAIKGKEVHNPKARNVAQAISSRP
jgi:hypothetical protein